MDTSLDMRRLAQRLSLNKESLQCREYYEVILTVCLLYNNRQVIYRMRDQFLPVKIRCDVEL